MQSRVTLGDILAWTALAAIWSSSYAVIKLGVATIDPAVLVFGRLAIGALILLAVLFATGARLSRRWADWGHYTVSGLMGSAVPFFLITYGEQTVDSALASIFMGLAPVASVALASMVFPDEPLTRRIVLGLICGVLGVVLLVGPSALMGIGQDLWGQLAIIAAGLCYASTTIYVRRFVTRPPMETAAGATVVAAISVGGFALLIGSDWTIQATPTALGAVLYLGLLPTALANLIYFYLVPRIGATRMSQVNFAVPVGGALIGALWLGEALGADRLGALGIIIVAIFLVTTRAKDSRRRES